MQTVESYLNAKVVKGLATRINNSGDDENVLSEFEKKPGMIGTFLGRVRVQPTAG